MAPRPRPCLDCGQLARASRCQHCLSRWHSRRDSYRGSAAQRGYDAAWRVLARAVLARDQHRCHWCGGPASTADHVVPKVHGGSDSLTNLVAACSRCNYGRTARTRRHPRPTGSG